MLKVLTLLTILTLWTILTMVTLLTMLTMLTILTMLTMLTILTMLAILYRKDDSLHVCESVTLSLSCRTEVMPCEDKAKVEWQPIMSPTKIAPSKDKKVLF